jgi:hypothetical protein
MPMKQIPSIKINQNWKSVKNQSVQYFNGALIKRKKRVRVLKKPGTHPEKESSFKKRGRAETQARLLLDHAQLSGYKMF